MIAVWQWWESERVSIRSHAQPLSPPLPSGAMATTEWNEGIVSVPFEDWHTKKRDSGETKAGAAEEEMRAAGVYSEGPSEGSARAVKRPALDC